MAIDKEDNAENRIPKNEQLENERDYKKNESNDKKGDDASAHRNIGANGYTQRTDQKDQLENLHIGGSDTTPYGANDHYNDGEQAQGPGFTKEGSNEMGNSIRTRDQEFGEKEPSGPAKPAHD
jgi:hypothetical protein